MLSAKIIPFELSLPLILPTIEGNVDYRELRNQLLRIDELLIQTGLESQWLEADLKQWLGQRPKVSAKAQQNRQCHSQRALRCNLARILLQEDFRGFAARLADSPLLQSFCQIGEVDRVKVPSKSTLQRYAVWTDETTVRELIEQLLCLGAQAPQKLSLTKPVDLEIAFVDTTCLAANIHYPVDWVLLRDATRTYCHQTRLEAVDLNGFGKWFSKETTERVWKGGPVDEFLDSAWNPIGTALRGLHFLADPVDV